jgi:hypothetical protein
LLWLSLCTIPKALEKTFPKDADGYSEWLLWGNFGISNSSSRVSPNISVYQGDFAKDFGCAKQSFINLGDEFRKNEGGYKIMMEI